MVRKRLIGATVGFFCVVINTGIADTDFEAPGEPPVVSEQKQPRARIDLSQVIPNWLSDEPVTPTDTPRPQVTPTPSGAAMPSRETTSSTKMQLSPDASAQNAEVSALYPRTPGEAAAPTSRPAAAPLVGQEKEATPLIAGLLREARQAFNHGNLIEPSHDNAYDRYRSVLVLDKNNRAAHAGLQEILRRYSFLINDALDNKRFRRADALLSQLAHYYPDSAAIAEHRRTLSKAREQHAPPAVASAGKTVAASEDIALPITPLDQRSDELLSLLSEIVVRLIESDESIMIYARSDAEGRWVYSQMKRLSGGYRIRGDIRISTSPRISVLPPL